MNIQEWVNSAHNPDDTNFRRAIHVLLLAIAKNNSLCQTLVIKGGIVMSLVHNSERYTSDLDATSIGNIHQLTPENLESDLTSYLKASEIEIGYGLAFKIHSIKPQPRDFTEAKYPAYKVKIGFAYQNNNKEMAKLENKQSPSIIEIDISFNERIDIEDTETIQLNESKNILCYSLEQIIAEKYRSLLQQPVRKRNRRQDVYDIYHLLSLHSEYLNQNEVKKSVLDKLKNLSQDKGIEKYLHKDGILDKEIQQRALEDFETLELEIDISKINPEAMFNEISSYFCSLPW